MVPSPSFALTIKRVMNSMTLVSRFEDADEYVSKDDIFEEEPYYTKRYST